MRTRLAGQGCPGLVGKKPEHHPTLLELECSGLLLNK